VTQVSPATGSAGTTITINGKNLDNVSVVKINGQTAANLQIVSSTQLTASLPGSGPVTQVQMISPCGTTTIPVATPTITSFTPGAGNPGTIITLTGTNLDQLDFRECGRSECDYSVAGSNHRADHRDAGCCHGQCVGDQFHIHGDGFVFFYSERHALSVFPAGSQADQQRHECCTGQLRVGECRRQYRHYRRSGRRQQQGRCLDLREKRSVLRLWSQQAKLVGTGAVGAAKQGTGVAISANGNTAAVGGPADNSNAGAVWIFTRSGTTWTQQGNKLTGSGAVGCCTAGYQRSHQRRREHGGLGRICR
jgi:hypothetical protein